jgi:hypothetical protein
MTFQFVVQRDPDGTWSVRERETNARAIDRGMNLSGLSESAAVQRAQKLNAHDRSLGLPREAFPPHLR